MSTSIQYQAKPFIKWAGGKKQLLNEIEKKLPEDFVRREVTYVEPFVGGGSVFFWLLQHYPNIKCAVINDINEKLINVYRVVKNYPDKLIAELQNLEETYIHLNQEERKNYFLGRREVFNDESTKGVIQAALFIFLNRTCFNGLYRENSKGKFNVPHGKYVNPRICDVTTIMADSEILQRVEILCGDFSDTAKYASPNTLYYFDPPYKPLSETSSFNSYVKESFDDTEQIRLRDFCGKIADAKSQFILSNSDVKGKNPQDNFFDELYEEYNIHRVLATRMVNANPEKRGKLTELMITNIQRNDNLFDVIKQTEK
jgi:DNA adenine methylase